MRGWITEGERHGETHRSHGQMASHVIRDRIWESRKLAACSRDAALAYPWIFLVADDWGRFEFSPRRIWSRVFGARPAVESKTDVRSCR